VFDFLSRQAADFLARRVQAGKNIVVAGRVSSGKTTLLNTLDRAIPGSERVVVCESSAELQLPEILANCFGGSRLREVPQQPRPAGICVLHPLDLGAADRVEQVEQGGDRVGARC